MAPLNILPFSLLLVASLNLIGCSGNKNIVIPDCLPKLVVQKPAPPPKRAIPSLPIDSVTSSTPNNEVVGKYAASIRILQAEVSWYRGVLKSYENASEMSKAVPVVAPTLSKIPAPAPPVKPKTVFGGLLPSTRKPP